MLKKRVKIKTKNPEAVLGAFGMGREDEDLILDLPDEKETYKILMNHPDIIDWDFVEPEEEKQEKEDESDGRVDMSWPDLVSWIIASWCVARRSPGLIPGGKLWESTILEEFERVREEETTIEALTLKTFLEVYYSGSLELANSDVVERIKLRWKELSGQGSIAAVASFLFKR